MPSAIMNRTLLFAVVSATLAGCASAPVSRSPDSTTLLGFTLKEPFTGFEECEWRSLSTEPVTRQYAADGPQMEPCYQRSKEGGLIGSASALGTEAIQLRFPQKHKPDLLLHDQLTLQLLEGRVHTVSAITPGLSHQAQAIRELTALFGKPTSQRKESRKSKTGEWGEIIEASWQRPSVVRIRYMGATATDFHQGYVEATTLQGAAYTRQRAEALRHPEPLR